MTSLQPISSAMAVSAARRPPPEHVSGLLLWVRINLFNGIHNCFLTGFALWAVFVTIPGFVQWALIDAVWVSDGPQACRAASGACWAVIAEKHRVILFGTFPYEEHWRGVLVIVIIVGMSILSAFRRFWSIKLVYAWIGATAIVFLLQFGGIFGLKPTGTHQWGGLPLTLIMFIGTILGGMPAAIFLALGRRSSLPAIKALCIGFVEIVRGVPLVTVLFMASLMFPLFMPENLTIDKFLRAQIGMIMFFGAYAAEIVRGGLQAISQGQYEAADGIGLTYWQKTNRIILPQALRIVLPALMNDIIRAFKNTTFISIIGLFDVLGATSTALEDPLWVLYALEAYLFIFALYFVFCFSMSKYSENVEKNLSKGRNL
jgi:general L-amino acid transport system permease protein